MNLLPKHLPLSTLSEIPHWNLHPWALDSIPQSTIDSFHISGILHPPIVIPEGDKGTYQILSGWRRTYHARSNMSQEDQIFCLVIANSPPEIELLDLILEDQLLAGPLSLPEKAQFLEIALQHYTPDEVIHRYQARLGLALKRGFLNRILSILREPSFFILAIHNGFLTEKIAMELLQSISPEERMALVSIFLNLGMGGGKQKKIFEMVRDCAIRGNISVNELLSSNPVQGILQHKEMNNPQKVQHLNEYLQGLLTPTYKRMEEDFQTKAHSLKLPGNYTLQHTPYFEKDEVTLSITFSNFDECQTYLNGREDTESSSP